MGGTEGGPLGGGGGAAGGGWRGGARGGANGGGGGGGGGGGDGGGQLPSSTQRGVPPDMRCSEFLDGTYCSVNAAAVFCRPNRAVWRHIVALLDGDDLGPDMEGTSSSRSIT
eukprot:247251-Prymnesium_polylepis.1